MAELPAIRFRPALMLIMARFRSLPLRMPLPGSDQVPEAARQQELFERAGSPSLLLDDQDIHLGNDQMISIVVCTYNRAPVLRKMLDSFFRQHEIDQIRHEVLIIDNNSDDSTTLVVQDFLKRGNVRYFLEPNQGLSFARNRGIAESKGEIISFLDDDVIVHEKWLSRLNDSFEHTGADVIGGRVSLRFEVPPDKWLGTLFRKCLSEVELGASRKRLSDGDCLYGANLSLRKKAFNSAGLFDVHAGRRKNELLSGEETQLLRRLAASGATIFYDPDASVEHLIEAERLQWRYFVRRADADGLTQELLDSEVSIGRQLMRVCSAIVGLLDLGFRKLAEKLRAKDSYERKLNEFVFLRQLRYTEARIARLMQQLREHYRRQRSRYRKNLSQGRHGRSACN